ncbi:NAD(+) hydrolase sarm1-like isoform X4 [Homarus americanus]|uniref:NAD(+) hydrolase sarm1-like isoform X4 n=1 Tax=Homarus americanus TaxID=6706 RepID=UPI001C482E78|nr:NAD(+) hydrolase sarm1-like isoform X4 [Homarus americanus]
MSSSVGGVNNKTWGREMEDKRKGWSRDPNGGWVRENTGGGSTSNLANANISNNLRNRRRSNSSVPSLTSNGNGYTNSVSPGGSQRGSSASPRAPHSKGFWVQEPEDYHSRWVTTKTPDSEGSGTPLTWPPTGGGGSYGRDGSHHRGACVSQPSSPHRAPATPPPLGCSTTLPKVYKSHATWVRNTEDPAAPPEHQPPSSAGGSPAYLKTPSPHAQMSGETGEGGPGGGGGGEVLDFQNRIKRFQQDQQFNQQQQHMSSSRSTSSSQLKRSQHTSHSHSSTNLSEVKSSSNTSEHKSSSINKSNLSELKSSMSEVKSNISEMTSQSNYNRSMSLASNAAMQQNASAASLQAGFNKRKASGFNMGSMDALNDALQMGSTEQLALPGVEDDFDLQNLSVQPDQLSSSPLTSGSTNGNNPKELKFEQKKVTSSSKTKVVTDKNSYESASGQSSESRKLQAGDVSYAELSKKAATKAKIEVDGITAEKAAAISQEARQLRAGEVDHREESQVKGATMRVAGEGFSAHRSAVSEQQQRQTKTPAGTINQESSRQAATSGLTIKTKGVCTKQSSSMTASQSNVHITGFDDLDNLSAASQPVDIQNAIMRYSGVMSSFVEQLKSLTVNECINDAPSLLENIDDMMRKAWSVPIYGHELGFSLCNVLRNNGGMDLLLDNCRSDDSDLKFTSAKVLEQCLTTENRGYVVEKGLENVVNVACDCTKNGTSIDKSRVGTGILEHLFKHSEGTCSDIIQLGGLDAVLSECRKSDVETLRHCAGALANLSLYGGSDNQQAMIQRKVPMWLFPLAFHSDDNIKYYACLAIATLVANKELEAAVLQSGTLNLVEPFVMNQIPDQFANSTVAHRHGQSQNWLQRLLPVLRSKREEARNLAAFHFCMEAGIKKRQGNIELFRDIGAVEPLKEVASSPNAIASKYAVQALRLIGEEVPHKLSQQVPLWTPEDVKEWVKQIGFSQHGDDFVNSRVDGDLLLQMTEENLREDIGVKNGILRQRFLRELRKLKHLADFSSCDSTRLNEFMVEIDKEFAEYTYRMLRAGVTRDCLRYLTEEQLVTECGINNSIHRQRIRDIILRCEKLNCYESGQLQDANSLDKTLDVFISYRRSNGSQLASLLKVHMQLKEFSVFIDVERLEAGKFDNNLLNSIRQAKNFLLVLTPNALDRCIGDTECKDWVHREIVAALQSGCKIIPIIDNFQWPDPEELPEDMRAVCYFNGVRWIHDYQDACVDKMERFMRGECNVRGDGPLSRYVSRSVEGGMATPGTPSTLPRAPPLYQRTTSTESGKGSSCSDKDPKD